MDCWWDRVVIPMRRVWINVTTRVGARKNGKLPMTLLSNDQNPRSRIRRELIGLDSFIRLYLCYRVVEAEEGGEDVRV